MRLIIKNNYDECSLWAANYVAYSIKSFHPTPKKPFVLGLCTGSTPLGMYQELIKMHKRGKLSFANVVTFNMDEYIGLGPKDEQSYHYFMHHNFFDHIDIPKGNIHLLNGLTKDYVKECQHYEELIKGYDKINLFIGGVGSDGHIAFNEPGSSLSSRTRVKTLTNETIEANSRFFNNDKSKVPTSVLTVGIGTITDADEVMILATGDKKARAIHHAVEGSINHMWPISILQMHQHSIIVCDDSATNELKADTVRYFKDIENKLCPSQK
ncbi:MAG: glucosamine-6-phosphate deaminase [Alphaproteobacteria bacterium]|nr:glucosamine-6-phosphate deaminase [Alphaproteobacteria bacterium]